MRMRAVDAQGDILPVLHGNDMLFDAQAVALFIEDRLNLLYGEWWENPSWGSKILKMMQEDRVTDANAKTLSLYLTGYVRGTKGVKDVKDEKYSINGRVFSWSCTAITEYGAAAVSYEF